MVRPNERRTWLPHLLVLALTATMLSAVLLVPETEAEAAGLPSGFVEEVVARNLVNPTTFEFARDGRLFVAEKRGTVKVFSSLTDTSPRTVVNLSSSVQDWWDRGLLGMALHPDFPATPHLYVLYTYDYNPNSKTHAVPSSWGDGCPTPPGPTADGCVVMGRLSRLVLDGDLATTEQVLIEDWCQQYPSHSIGQLAFGDDGALYASAGDGASFNFADYGQRGIPLNPCGDPPGGVGGTMTPPTAEGGALRSQDLRTPGDPVTLDGAVIRIDPATGAGLPDNPLASSSDANARRIVAYGLRNPFRFAVRPGTNELWIGDVGWSTWEEINRVVDPKSGPVNFGWPCYEGPNKQSSYAGLNLNICDDLYKEVSTNPSAHTQPYFAYRHGQRVGDEACSTNSGSSVSGIAFEFYDGGTYPDEYRNALFFADYARNCIWAMQRGDTGVPAPGRIRPFREGAASPVDLQVGPDGNLYYADLNGGTIRRIVYNPDAPPPVTDCQPADGSSAGQEFVGLDVGSPSPAGSASWANGRWTVAGAGADIWSTSDSFHFACRPLAGDGTVTARVVSQTNTDPWAKSGVMMRASTAANAPHAMVVTTPSNGVAFQYRTAAGGVSTNIAGPSGTVPRWVRLTRAGSTLTGQTSTDGTTWTTIGSVDISLGTSPRVGMAVTSHHDGTLSTAEFEQVSLPGQSAPNEPPTAFISAPASALTWAVGDNIAFSGSGTDPEDGTLPPSNLTWDVVLHHCARSSPTSCHTHQVESFPGVSSGSFVAPDHDWPSHVELRLTATDSAGATHATSVALQPKTVDLTFATTPAGLSLVAGDDSLVAPFERTFVVNATTGISAPSPQTLNGTSYTFGSWDHGGNQSQTLTVPATAQTYTANYSAGQAPFALSIRGYKDKGLQKADLTWSGATATSIDVFRDGRRIATVPNNGAYTDHINARGNATYVYRVCNAGTSTCSDSVTVRP